MKLLGIITLIALACAVICGTWMKANPGMGSVSFHAALSCTAAGLSALTIILYMVKQ